VEEERRRKGIQVTCLEFLWGCGQKEKVGGEFAIKNSERSVLCLAGSRSRTKPLPLLLLFLIIIIIYWRCT
jgi:hypothetical protein